MKEYLSIITLLEYNQKLANVLKTISYYSLLMKYNISHVGIYTK